MKTPFRCNICGKPGDAEASGDFLANLLAAHKAIAPYCNSRNFSINVPEETHES